MYKRPEMRPSVMNRLRLKVRPIPQQFDELQAMQHEQKRRMLYIERVSVCCGPTQRRLQILALQAVENVVQFRERLLFVRFRRDVRLQSERLGHIVHSLPIEMLADHVVDEGELIGRGEHVLATCRREIRHEIPVDRFTDFRDRPVQVPVVGR